jgi:Zn-dependent metalloprotease
MKWLRVTAVLALTAAILLFGAQQLHSSYAAAPSGQTNPFAPINWDEVGPNFPDTSLAGLQSGANARHETAPQAPLTATTCGGMFPVTADAWVKQASPNNNYGVAALLASQDSPTSNQTRILLKFDPSGSVPEGAVIQKAELELTLYQDPTPPTYTLQVYSQSDDWNEYTVNWSNQPTPTIGFGPITYAITHTEPVSSVVRLDVTTWAILYATGAITHTGLTVAPAGSPAMYLLFYGREVDLTYAARLKIYCRPKDTVVTLDPAPGDLSQMAGLTRLRLNSTVTPTIQFDDGSLRFAEFQIPVPSTVTYTGTARAEWFTHAYSDLLRLSDYDSLQILRRSEDGQDVFFRQLFNGIPVYPTEIGVHLRGDQVIAVNERIIRDMNVDPDPQLSAEQAAAIALALTGEGVEVIGDTQLSYLNLGLSGDPDTNTYLTWRVNLSNNSPAFIDANSGKLLLNLVQDTGSFDLDLDTREYLSEEINCPTWFVESTSWCDEEGCDEPADAEARAAFNNIRHVYYYWTTIGRDSYDNLGSEVEMYVHASYNPPGNASYQYGLCEFFTFDTGYSSNLEVVGHEFTHGVIQHVIPHFIYNNEPGALSESFSDIFGHFAGNENDWIFGNGLPDPRSIRSMSNPDRDRYSKYNQETGDNGGVHVNSGINTKAAYLITHGDQFRGYDTRPGIGQLKAQMLFYMMLDKFSKWATLMDARNWAVATIREMKQTHPEWGVTDTDICIVLRAYAAVELGNGDGNCDGVEDSIGPDSDYDGIPDIDDLCDDTPNTSNTDGDGDGMGDACDNNSDKDIFPDNTPGWGVCSGGNSVNCNDNCPFEDQPDQADWNNNGIGDACEDYDGDTKKDNVDNCVDLWNKFQENHDTDPMGDICDPDDDNDDKLDGADNCQYVPNHDQTDHDQLHIVGGNPVWWGDGIGDACDLCPFLISSDNSDPDFDKKANPCDLDDDGDDVEEDGDHSGVEGDVPCTWMEWTATENCDDNCPTIKNKDQFDWNQNGVGSTCDPGDGPGYEQEDWHTYTWTLGGDVTIPLPGAEHPNWGESLERGYRQTVIIETNVDVFARITDSSGNLLDQSSKHGSSFQYQTLSFEPAPYAFEAGGAWKFGVNAPLQPAWEILPSDTDYYLQLYPTESTPLTETVTLTLQISGGAPINLYLPVIRK